jgi:glycosyltransferase involved in cell wall biosynthesis
MKVSAIIPVYNGERWIAEAITSIKEQTRPVDELIVVDDGSTDASAALASGYGAKVVQLKTNQGEGAARNRGLRNAGGDLIAWLDADDIWAPNHIETALSLLERYPQATAAFGAVQRFGLRRELITGYIPVGPPVNVFWAAVDDWLHTTIGSVTRRDALLAIGGFSEERRYAVDYDLWLRLSRDHLFVCTHEVTSFWRWHADQQSQNYASQVSAVYHFRHRYFTNERSSGDPELAEQLGIRINHLWARDFRQALNARDLKLAKCLLRCAKLVPNFNTATLMRSRMAYYRVRAGGLLS